MLSDQISLLQPKLANEAARSLACFIPSRDPLLTFVAFSAVAPEATIIVLASALTLDAGVQISGRPAVAILDVAIQFDWLALVYVLLARLAVISLVADAPE